MVVHDVIHGHSDVKTQSPLDPFHWLSQLFIGNLFSAWLQMIENHCALYLALIMKIC